MRVTPGHGLEVKGQSGVLIPTDDQDFVGERNVGAHARQSMISGDGHVGKTGPGASLPLQQVRLVLRLEPVGFTAGDEDVGGVDLDRAE